MASTSLSQYVQSQGWRPQPGQPPPGSTTSTGTTPQPYDPVTGLPVSQTSTAGPIGAPPSAGTSTAPGGLVAGLAAAHAQNFANPSVVTTPMTEARSGLNHFGGDPSTGGVAPTASDSGTTPTQQSPQNYLEDLYKQLGGAYLSPSYLDSSVGGLQSQLGQPGAAEQFYQQAQNTQTDPYYQRLRQQGQDALNQQMAARGNYNSGGALAALGNFDSGLAAQQYAQMGQLAQNAQNGQQSRVGLSGQLAQTADAGDLSRLNSLFGVAGQAQGMNQQGINNMLAQQMGISNMNAGLIGGFYGNGGQLSGQSQTDAINALIQAGQAQAQGQQAQQGQLLGLAGMFA